MRIKLVAIANEKGSGQVNEDRARLVGNSAYVLDGATGLNGKNLLDGKSDAGWLVNFWDAYLCNHVNDKIELKEVVRKGIEESFKAYEKLVKGIKVTSIDYPSAAIAIVRLRHDKLEYFILGDCSVVTKYEGKLKFYMDERLSDFDNEIYRKMKKLHQRGIMEHEKVKSLLMKDIIYNRLKKNTLEGYWILEFMVGAADNGKVGEIQANENMEVAIMTDGFSAIVDKYHLISTSEAFEEGIEKAILKLRNFEKLDVSAVKVPRFKAMDDASCVHLKIVDN